MGKNRLQVPGRRRRGRIGESHAVLGVPPPRERWSPLNEESWKPLSKSTPLAPQVMEMLGSITEVPVSCTRRPGGDVA